MDLEASPWHRLRSKSRSRGLTARGYLEFTSMPINPNKIVTEIFFRTASELNRLIVD